MPTVEYAVCIYVYLFFYLFIGFSGSTVVTNSLRSLFTMPGMQRVVYAKSSQILTTTSYCALLI